MIAIAGFLSEVKERRSERNRDCHANNYSNNASTESQNQRFDKELDQQNAPARSDSFFTPISRVRSVTVINMTFIIRCRL